MKLSLNEMAKLIKELQELSKIYHDLKAKSQKSSLTGEEMMKMENAGARATGLNKQRIKLLPLYTPEEIAEIRKLVEAM